MRLGRGHRAALQDLLCREVPRERGEGAPEDHQRAGSPLDQWNSNMSIQMKQNDVPEVNFAKFDTLPTFGLGLLKSAKIVNMWGGISGLFSEVKSWSLF